ncbi:hypothetical protein [Lactiplantibacillus xiangfangensis]|uniref:hypothetical protein n=1 Tax=Lactiplantibacillus xiangfangensis TaxID=942150 RepID=UPI00384B55E2
MQSKMTFHGLLSSAVAHRKISNGDFSKSIHVSMGQGSRYRSGKRLLDKSMRLSVTRLLRDVRLSMAAATKDYQIPTVKYEPNVRHDVFTTSNDQEREENERKAREPLYKLAVRVPIERRTPEQQQIIDDFLKDYLEEFTSEETDWLTQAEYSGKTSEEIFQMFSEFNKRFAVEE